MSLLDHALALAAKGVPVFPMTLPKKLPLAGSHGHLDASCDPEVIRAMFRQRGAALVAIRTGGPSGVVALDADTPEAEELFQEWLRSGRLPTTRVHATWRGVHLLYRHDPAHPLRSTSGRLAPGVDTRGDGGALVWWPAVGLRVRRDVPLGDLPTLPAWVADAAAPPPPKPSTRPAPIVGASDGRAAGFAAGALRSATERVARAPDGTGNSTLNREAWGLARFVVDGLLAATEVFDQLVNAAIKAGHPARKAEGTVISALRKRGVAI
jgi:hypothetical protein